MFALLRTTCRLKHGWFQNGPKVRELRDPRRCRAGLQQETKHQTNRNASTWLQERLRQLEEQTAAAERAVVAFKQQNGIVSADGKAYRRAEFGRRPQQTARCCSQPVIRGLGSFNSTRVHHSHLESKHDRRRWQYFERARYSNSDKLAPAVSGSVEKGGGVGY
jgi:hypothetical protein